MASGFSTQIHHAAVTRRSRSQFDLLPTAVRIIWVLIIASAILTTAFTLYPEWIRLKEMKLTLAKQKAEFSALQKVTHEHEQQIHYLETDKDYLETIARDRLDMMKEGETIFHLSGTQHPRS